MTSPVPFGEWQPIETAPKDGTVILGRRIHEGRLVTKRRMQWRRQHFPALPPDPLGRSWPSGCESFGDAYDAEGWMLADEPYRMPGPTHWMPLPSPPEK